MKRLTVNASTSYEILIGEGLLQALGENVSKVLAPCKAAIITDDKVGALYAETAERSLQEKGFSTVRFTYKNGEQSKTPTTVLNIVNFLAESGLTRSDIVVALGGGVTGDMAGFAASIYLRGLPFVNVPTTLLAMVDSAVGGKTGCNLESGKNLLGSFWQPRLVLCDTKMLMTLEQAQIAEGVAEAIKTGVIADERLFALLENGFSANMAEEVIERCVKVKAALVEKDERDNAARQLLNFGHTVGHAIEKASGYKISHGNAVAAGMVYETAAALAMGVSNTETLERIKAVLTKNGLPVSSELEPEELAKIALHDKKRKGERLTMVVPKRLGECALIEINTEEIETYFKSAFRR